MDLATELLVGYYMDFANFITLVGANLGGCREFKYGLEDADLGERLCKGAML